MNSNEGWWRYGEYLHLTFGMDESQADARMLRVSLAGIAEFPQRYFWNTFSHARDSLRNPFRYRLRPRPEDDFQYYSFYLEELSRAEPMSRPLHDLLRVQYPTPVGLRAALQHWNGLFEALGPVETRLRGLFYLCFLLFGLELALRRLRAEGAPAAGDAFDWILCCTPLCILFLTSLVELPNPRYRLPQAPAYLYAAGRVVFLLAGAARARHRKGRLSAPSPRSG